MVWHFLNLKITVGTHIEGREGKRKRKSEKQRQIITKREKFKK